MSNRSEFTANRALYASSGVTQSQAARHAELWAAYARRRTGPSLMYVPRPSLFVRVLRALGVRS